MGTFIREAREADIDWLLPQLGNFAATCGLERPIMGSEDHCRSFLRSLMQDGVFLIAHKDEVRVGFIAGTIHPHPFNPDNTVLSEVFFWVDPQFRFSRASLMLLEEFKQFGQDCADLISFSLLTNSPVKPSSLTRRGFKAVESSYLMEVA